MEKKVLTSLFLFIFALDRVQPGLTHELTDVIQVMKTPSDVRKEIFSRKNSSLEIATNWLLIFHHGDFCKQCISTAFNTIAFALWLKATFTNGYLPLKIGILTCEEQRRQWELFFPGKCDHKNNKILFFPSSDKKNSPENLDPENVYNFLLHSSSLLSDDFSFIFSHLRSSLAGNYSTSLRYQRPQWITTRHRIAWPKGSQSGAIISTKLHFPNFHISLEREMNSATKNPASSSRGDDGNIGSQQQHLTYYPSSSFPNESDGSHNRHHQVYLAEKLLSGESRHWNSHWILNALLQFGKSSNGAIFKAFNSSEQQQNFGCNFRRHMYTTLDEMIKKGADNEKETFSLSGFVTNFMKVCRDLTSGTARSRASASEGARNHIMSRKSRSNSTAGEESDVGSKPQPDTLDDEESKMVAKPTSSSIKGPQTDPSENFSIENEVGTKNIGETDFSSSSSDLNEEEEKQRQKDKSEHETISPIIVDKTTNSPSPLTTERGTKTLASTSVEQSGTTERESQRKDNNVEVIQHANNELTIEYDLNATTTSNTITTTTTTTTSLFTPKAINFTRIVSVIETPRSRGAQEILLTSKAASPTSRSLHHDDDPQKDDEDKSYVGRYLDMMDELLSPAMIRFRLTEIFRDYKPFPNSSWSHLTEFARSKTSERILKGRQRRWKLRMNKRCRDHHKQGKAFVKNQLRDVVYESDLLLALKLSLNFEETENANFPPPWDEQKTATLMNYLQVLREIFPPLKNPEQDSKLRSYLHVLEQYLRELVNLGHKFSLNNFLQLNLHLQSDLNPFASLEVLSSQSLEENSPLKTPRNFQPGEKMRGGWIGCQDGGFPCALWQLFHVLTVEYAHRWKWNDMNGKEYDILGILLDYVGYFYDFTSKSLFTRFVHLNPPKESDANPEDSALWLWNIHNQMNLALYDFAMSKTVQTGWLELPSLAICNARPFPHEKICPLCYKADEMKQKVEQHAKTGCRNQEEQKQFQSRKVILRYLFAVYTRQKIM